jgi:hypothetical protein
MRPKPRIETRAALSDMAAALAGATWHTKAPDEWTPAEQAAFERIVGREKELGMPHGESVLGGWMDAFMWWPTRVVGQARHSVNGHVWYSDIHEMIPRVELEARGDDIPPQVQRWFHLLDDPSRDW